MNVHKMAARRPRRFRWPGSAASGLVAVTLACATFIGTGGAASAASGATMRVEPSATSIAGGTTFTAKLIENASVSTFGAEATLTFDPTLVQVTDLKTGPGYAKGLSIFGVAFDGTADKAKVAADKANQTGTVVFVASGITPAGDATVMTLTMVAVKGPGGKASLALRSPLMYDQGGNTLPATATDGSVTVAETPGVTAPPPPSGLTAITPPPESVAVSVLPEHSPIAVGDTVAVVVKVSTTSTHVGLMKVSVAFDQTVLQVQKVEAGPLVKGAKLQSDLTTVEAGIATANSSGKLNKITFIVPEAADAQGMDGTVLSVTMKGVANGTSTLDLSVALETPDGGYITPVVAPPSQLVVGSGGTSPPDTGTIGSTGTGTGSGADPLFVGLAVILILLALGDLLIFILPRRSARLERWTRRWPLVISLGLALIPVFAFVGIVAIVVVNALPAVSDPGLGALLDSNFSGIYNGGGGYFSQYGLLPAIWGTVLITAVALLVALPVSLAMAVVSTEFQLGPLGRVIRPMVGILSGIPPIVYAVSMLVFVQTLTISKLAGNSQFATFKPQDIGAGSPWPPSDVPWAGGSMPWALDLTSGNSMMLAGILIGMLLIPFITPMIADAIRNVPNSAREASLALGANRGYTLRRAILPMAKPGIATALVLGTLKAMGDVIIVSFVAGWEADHLPNPILDVLEKGSTLSTQGANMIVIIKAANTPSTPTAAAVGFMSALLLLVAAALLVLLMNFLKARWRRSLGA